MALLCTFSSFSVSCFRYGFHTWMQYSNCGLSNDLYSLSIVSLSPVTLVLLIRPKFELASFDISVYCPEGFALLCIITLNIIKRRKLSYFGHVMRKEGERNPAGHYAGSKKTRKTKNAMDGQHGRMDRNAV